MLVSFRRPPPDAAEARGSSRLMGGSRMATFAVWRAGSWQSPPPERTIFSHRARVTSDQFAAGRRQRVRRITRYLLAMRAPCQVYGAFERALFAQCWEAEKASASTSGRPPSVKAAALASNVGISTARRLATKIEAKLSLDPAARGGAKSTKIDETELAYLQLQIDEARYSRDRHYSRALQRDLGVVVSRRTVARHLSSTLDTTCVKAKQETLDKFTDENKMRYWEFIRRLWIFRRVDLEDVRW
eukprot:scaffold2792_cov145-Pinguiococcus_pyrenoidosus.AAC.1